MVDRAGQTFGSYRLEGLLGRGGMGEVYRARHLRLTNRLAAVKILPASFASDPDFLRRFEQEANNAASLDHPNILPVWDYGEQDGTPFLAMPLVPAGSLKELLERRGPLSPTEAERYLAPIADALDYAHSRGILHRDVKPANILLREDGRPQLADFGIAKAIEAGQAGEGLTGTGGGIGTPEYMAPEQIEGRAEPRSDLYALGIALYQLLGGQLPYDGATPYEVALKQLGTPLPPLRQLRPDLSPAIEATVARALAKDPAARYPTGRAFAAAFHEAIMRPDGVPVPAPGIYDQRTTPLQSVSPQLSTGGRGVVPAVPVAPAFVPLPPPAPQQRVRRNTSWPLLIGALILAALIVGVGGVLALRTPAAPPPPTPTRAAVVVPPVDPTLTAVAALDATTVAGINATATTNAAQGATATAVANAALATATASAVAAEGATATAVEGANATARAASSATARAAAAAATASADATATVAANATAAASANAAASATARAATPARTPTATALPPTNTAVPPTNTPPPATVAPTVAPTRAPSAAPSPAPTRAGAGGWGPALAPLGGGRRYADPANRFSFSVPLTWVQDQNADDQLTFAPTDNSSTFSASLDRVAAATTLEAFNAAVEQQVRGSCPATPPSASIGCWSTGIRRTGVSRAGRRRGRISR